MRIYKYYLSIGHLVESVISVPSGSKLLDIGIQNGNYHAWFEVNPELPKMDFSIYCIYTGSEFNSIGLQYVKTVIESDTFVAHFYIKRDMVEFLAKDEMSL